MDLIQTCGKANGAVRAWQHSLVFRPLCSLMKVSYSIYWQTLNRDNLVSAKGV